MISYTHPKSDDLDITLSFMIQCDIAEFGEADSSREDLEELWSEIDLSKDAWIALDKDGKIIGYTNVSDTDDGCQVDIYIDIVQTPAGVGDELMYLCEKRAREKIDQDSSTGSMELKGFASTGNARMTAVYEAAGFSAKAWHYRMRIDLPGTVIPPELPRQYSLSPYTVSDEQELYRLIENAFDWPGRKTNPIEYWRSLVFRGGRYDPELFLMVHDGGKLVGAALAYDDGGSGWIRQLAVSKDHQGMGVGSLLLRQIFSVFAARKIYRVALGVAAVNNKAYQFYERNGMYRSREFTEYRKTL